MTPNVKLFLAAFGLLLATVFPALAAPTSITGQVTYRERIALPPDAMLEVQLLDISRADAPAVLRAAARLSGPGQVPLTFSLNFDDKVINPKHTYALSARITSGGKLAFLNTTRYEVDPLAPAQPIMIVLDFVGHPEAAPAPKKPAAVDETAMTEANVPASALFGTTWRATDIAGKPVPEGTRTTLSVAEDGRTGGKGGCNNYFTQATLAGGNAITFGSPASTRMMCPDPAMQQEAAFFAALGAVTGFTVDGNKLTLKDANGQPVVNLVKE